MLRHVATYRLVIIIIGSCVLLPPLRVDRSSAAAARAAETRALPSPDED
jgi:hypothetical protein